MTQNPQEAADLAKMLDEIIDLKCKCIDMQIEYARMEADELRHSGHRIEKHGSLVATRAAAIQYTLDSTMRDIKKLNDAFLRKYPD